MSRDRSNARYSVGVKPKACRNIFEKCDASLNPVSSAICVIGVRAADGLERRRRASSNLKFKSHALGLRSCLAKNR